MQILSVALLAAAALADVIPVTGTVPDKSTTYIKDIVYGGSGCNQGTVSSSISEDLTTFTLIFDSFIASSGPGVAITESRKNCQINVDLHYPQGWSYSVVEVDYRGYVNVPAGVTATQSATYYFSGQTTQYTAKTNFKGPYAGDYLTSDKIPTSNIVWSPCGKVVAGNINAKATLTGNLSLPSLMTTDSIDGKVTQIFALQWRKCK